jgi:hypothetical protein
MEFMVKKGLYLGLGAAALALAAPCAAHAVKITNTGYKTRSFLIQEGDKKPYEVVLPAGSAWESKEPDLSIYMNKYKAALEPESEYVLWVNGALAVLRPTKEGAASQ